MRLLVAALLLVSLSPGLLAQNLYLEVVTDPDGATVRYLDGDTRVLGRTSEKIPLQVTRQPPHRLVIEKEGYHPLPVTLDLDDVFKNGGRYPTEGELRLTPTLGTRVGLLWARYHQGILVLMGMAVALVLSRRRTVASGGPRVGKYRLGETLGEGGTAVVYRGSSRTPPQEVAVKILRPELCLDPISKARFQRELELSAVLEHPNLVKVHEWGETDSGGLYLVTELLKGETLKAKGRRLGRLPWSEALQILTEVAGALEHLHQNGVLHRDVKPGNIFVTQGGSAKLLDLGLVCSSSASTSVTKTGIAVGTPTYMAPERFQGEAGEASDQYSLGVVAFEILTGSRPFEGGNELADAVVRRMLAKEPKQRFQSVTEAVERLAEALRDSGDDTTKSSNNVNKGDPPAD